MIPLLAQVGAGFGGWAILAVVLCGIVALVTIGARALGITIPPFVQQVVWVIIIVVVIVFGIRLITGA